MPPEDESGLVALREENRRLLARLAELEQANQRLHLFADIAESNQDLIAAQDTEFRYLAFNAAYRRETKRVFGVDVEIGGSMVEALAPLPADREKAVALWGRALRGEAFTTTEMFHGIGEPRYFEGHWHPLYDRDGAILGASHIVREVTGRVRAENALRQSEEEFRAFFENATVGAVQLDRSGQFLRVNDCFCRMTGYSRAELLALTPFDITHPDSRALDREGFDAIMRGDRDEYTGEKRYLRKDGRDIWVLMAAAVVRDLAGQPLRSAAIIQDISQRKGMEEELRKAKTAAEEASRAKSEFLASMSHEIRTPMTVFLAALDHLLEIDSDPKRREFLDLAENSAQKLRVLLDDLLDVSRIEARRVELREVPFELSHWLRQLLDLFSMQAAEKGLFLNVEIAAGVPETVVGDPDRLGQVLMNLLSNAIKFTEQGGVTVAVAAADGWLRLAVSDTGIGVPAASREQLFGLFNQLDPVRARKYGGTGLGLAICRGLVELMGGRIDMQPRPGGGSVFTVAVPLRIAARTVP